MKETRSPLTVLDEYRATPKPKLAAVGCVIVEGKAERPACLNFFTSAQDHYAFPYGQLVWANFSPAKSSIQLHFSSHTVAVGGTRLEMLYREILRQRVAEIAAPVGRTELRDLVGETAEAQPEVLSVRVAQAKGMPYGAAFGGDNDAAGIKP